MKKIIGMLIGKLRRKKIILLLNTEADMETRKLSRPVEFAKKVAQIHGPAEMPS